jgi:hypothetical protein
VFEQHLGAAFAGFFALRRRLDLDLVGGYPRPGQSGGDRLSAVESSSVAIQLLDGAASGPGIADDANLAGFAPPFSGPAAAARAGGTGGNSGEAGGGS